MVARDRTALAQDADGDGGGFEEWVTGRVEVGAVRMASSLAAVAELSRGSGSAGGGVAGLMAVDSAADAGEGLGSFQGTS